MEVIWLEGISCIRDQCPREWRWICPERGACNLILPKLWTKKILLLFVSTYWGLLSSPTLFAASIRQHTINSFLVSFLSTSDISGLGWSAVETVDFNRGWNAVEIMPINRRGCVEIFQPRGWIQPLQPHFNRSLLFKIIYLKVPWTIGTQEIRIALWGLLSRVTKRKEGGEWSPLNLCLHMACVLCVCVCVMCAFKMLKYA